MNHVLNRRNKTIIRCHFTFRTFRIGSMDEYLTDPFIRNTELMTHDRRRRTLKTLHDKHDDDDDDEAR